ncbi:MAG: ParB/RepB/Spo0J family partition protein [Schleiferiaceae bacterium]
MAKRAMGKGLSAILGEEIAKVNKVTDAGAEKLVGQVAMISLDAITTNPFQPRSNFDNDALVELAQSISELGIIQPITVRKNGMKFELISGERRFRASQIAGLEEIPAYVRLADDRNMLELAIVENLQREDLDPIEMAYSCKRMMDELGLTQEEVAKRLGKGRSTVTNFLRLLKLPAIIQAELRDINRNESLDENSDGITSVVFSMGHARALLNLPSEESQIDLYKKILKGGLSVRQTEALAAAIKKPKEKAPEAPVQPGMKELGKELGQYFQTKVNIQVKPSGKGRIQIDFDSDDDLQRIISKFNS